MIRSAACNDENLLALLDADEDSDRFRAAATHVDSCTDCQRRLTELSGDGDFWVVQREMLRPVEGDEPESGMFHRYRSPESLQLGRSVIEESAVRELLAPPSHPEMLGRLGRYEIERIIGVGGMGIVLKGFDSELNRPVAIKLLAPHLARVGAARQRFAREAKAAAAVVHEHVVPIHNVESEHAQPFLVMQFIPGESLQARVEREGPLTVTEILRIGRQAAAGLAAAHAQGLVHRDVKPANILLENGVERVYLTDFGLARASDDASLTRTGVVAGTPHYMSPEQADGQPLDHRSDLFSLGSVLYFMATGHPPFRAERPLAVLKRICHDPHRPVWQGNAEIPEALSEIVDRLLEKNPGARFQTAAELEQVLAKALVDVQQGRIRRRGAKSSWQRWIWRAAVCFAACIVLAAAGAGLLKLLVDEAPIRSEVQSDGEKMVDQASASPLSPLSPLEQLQSRDPSPLLQSDAELDALSDLLDELESTPFPESPFNPPPGAGSKTEPTAPGEGDAAKPREGSALRWRFNFHGAPWKEVLEWFSTIADRPLCADEFPDGTFNYADRKPCSLEEIANVLDAVLRTQDFLLKLAPTGIHVIRLNRNRAVSRLGPKLPAHDELVADRTNLLRLRDEIARLTERRDSLTEGASDRDTQLAVLKAESDSLHNQVAAALAAIKAKSEEAKLAFDESTALLARVDAINAVSADCVPLHVVLRLKREQLECKAALDEINAVLDLDDVAASARTKG
jgi:serine/threonine protein kinase